MSLSRPRSGTKTKRSAASRVTEWACGPCLTLGIDARTDVLDKVADAGSRPPSRRTGRTQTLPLMKLATKTYAPLPSSNDMAGIGSVGEPLVEEGQLARRGLDGESADRAGWLPLVGLELVDGVEEALARVERQIGRVDDALVDDAQLQRAGRRVQPVHIDSLALTFENLVPSRTGSAPYTCLQRRASHCSCDLLRAHQFGSTTTLIAPSLRFTKVSSAVAKSLQRERVRDQIVDLEALRRQSC